MNDSIKLLNLNEEDVETLTSYIENDTLYINLTLCRKENECPNRKNIINTIRPILLNLC